MTRIANRKSMPARLLSLGVASLLIAGCGGGGDEGQMPPTQVNVSTVVKKKVAQWDEFTGRIEAVESAQLRPRVAGFITGVHFREGGLVDKGDLLFSIDDREYRAAVSSARADVARAEARVGLARTELARSETLIQARAVSEGELQSRSNEAKQANADLLAARARLQTAELNLSFTRITAPFKGRVGGANLRIGNLVSPGEPVLTTLVSLDPVYVAFEGDERAYLRYQTMAKDGTRQSSRDVANPVRVSLANETGFPHEGKMVFVDNALDPGTGTIRARAELANPDGAFTPGLFARVRLLGSGAREALLIHPQAVLNDQDRKFVYVAGKGDAATRKDIVLGPEIDGLVVVESGLAAGDRVVVNGMRKIFFPGAPLAPVDVPMDAPNTPPPPPANAPAAGGGEG
jgi:multidrug efflux system membrane fusion protein